MRVINPPAFTNAERLTAARLNSIHFGGIHTTLDSDRSSPATSPTSRSIQILN